MTQFDYDLFVIGGGSGGVRAGRVVASMGNRVAIAEEYRYGGTCVIRGCVPKKLMVYASHFHESFEDAAGFGWSVGESSFDWEKLIANKDQEIDRLEGLYKKGLSNADADIFETRAVLEGPNQVRLLNENRVVSAKRIMIAVGGTPSSLKGVEGADLCINSDDVFHLDRQPKSIAIFGGGFIAVEFACIFAGLGTKTTLVYRGDKILRGFDHDIRENLQEEMIKKGINVICGANATKFEETNDGGVTITLDNSDCLHVDKAMLAVGRKPLTDDLGLDKVGVEINETGHIEVDSFSKTNVSSIWAVGDVTDRVPLTPVAIHESMCFIETEYKNNPTMPDHELVATAVFSQPEIGTVGLSEEDAVLKLGDVDIFLAKFRPMKHTLSGRDEKMMMKLVVDAKNDQVVGVHVMGEGAGEMSQLLAIALKSGATKSDFDRTMAVHPTASEELVTMYQPSYRIVDGKRVD